MGPSTKAERPASQDATSPAKILHREQVNEISVTVFADHRVTVQRRYRSPKGETGYASSLRPSDFDSVRAALAAVETWLAKQAGEQPERDAK